MLGDRAPARGLGAIVCKKKPGDEPGFAVVAVRLRLAASLAANEASLGSAISPTPRQSKLHALKNTHAAAISGVIGQLD
jgi:hypothetical protein